jgi:hypothetical protein
MTKFKSFKTFQSFQPPPLSFPATRGRIKEGVELLERLERFEPEIREKRDAF